MKQVKNAAGFLLSMGMFRIVCMVYVLLNVVPSETQPLLPFMKLFHVYAFAVVLWDLFTKQRVLRNKGRIVLALFVLGSIVTYLCNPNLLNFSGISDYLYLLWFLLIIYSYDPASDKEMRWFNRLIAVLITAMNVIGIWMFFEKYIYYAPNGHIGMYPHENRLCGLFVNPNVLSAVSYGAIALGALLLKQGRRGDKVLGIIAITVNFLTLIMANSRSYILAMCAVAMVLVFGLLWEKRKKLVSRAGMALLGALLMFTVCLLTQRLIPVAEQAVDGVKDFFASLEASFMGDGQGGQAGSPGLPVIPTDPTLGTKPVSGDVFGREPTEKLNGRMDIWGIAVRMILRNPVFGVGLNNHQHAAAQLGEEFTLSAGGVLHCAYLDGILAFGLVGLLILCSFVLLVLGNLRKFFKYCPDSPKRKRVILLIALIAGFAVAGVVDSMILFSMYPTALLWWTLLAQLMQTVESELKKTVHYRPDLLGMVWDGLFRPKRTGKKLCFVNDSLGGGGAERVLLDVTRALKNEGMDITVVTLRSGGELEEKLEPGIRLQSLDPFDIPLLKRALHWLNRHRMPRRLYNFLLLDGRYEYTVAFLEGLSTILVADTRIGKEDKKYAWVHIDMKHQNWVLPFYKSLDDEIASYQTFHKVFCVSDQTKKAFVEVIGCEETAVTLYNLMDVPRIVALGQASCPEERPEGLLLCAIGRLNDQKGFDRLIPIVGKLQKKGLGVTLWILGEGAKREELEAQISELKLNEQVRLLGFRENPYCFAAQADVFVLSSRAEGFGLVVTENLLLGKPVVATDCAGIREQLGDDEYGIVTENTEEALLAGLERMLRDENLRSHYAAKAQEKAAQLSYEKQVQQFVDIFS